MTPGLALRTARGEDAGAAGDLVARSRGLIHQVRRELLGEEICAAAFPDEVAEKRRSVAALVGGRPGQALLAEVDGRLAGVVCWDVRPDGGVGELLEVTVDPDFQGRGIGTAMCRRAIKMMRERGARTVLVKTGLDRGHADARRFYEKLGFGPALSWIHYYQEINALGKAGRREA